MATDSNADALAMKLTVNDAPALAFRAMRGVERFGRTFEYHVEALADDGTIAPATVLGKPAGVTVELMGGQQRHFHGLVTAFSQGGPVGRLHSYRLVLRPWLWLLTRRADTRIFQNLSVPDIVKQVLSAFSADFDLQLEGSFPAHEYRVQYRETDHDFVHRLLEEEGIYYYFTHAAAKHTMVLVNAPGRHVASPLQSTFVYRDTADAHLEFEPITAWHTDYEVQSGKVTVRDYDFESPANPVHSSSNGQAARGPVAYEVYDYLNAYSRLKENAQPDGTRISKLRIEERQSPYLRAHGGGSVRAIACGYRFSLTEHPRSEQNADYLVIGTEIEMRYSAYESEQDETRYECRFTAIGESDVYRPPRVTPRPVVGGPHTAVVVGPSGEEIYTDKYGRVKVQFHWDRLGQKNENSSCWIRVSSPWAGQNWGAIQIPRIGQEVVVDFLEGDPDRPLVTGRVYNAVQMPPWPLPANATVSTIKSRSSKSGAADNFNELRFEDKKGEEYVWFQAEKDLFELVKNDHKLLVKRNQDKIVRGDLTEQIDGKVHRKVGADNVLEVVGGHSLKVTGDAMAEVTGSVSLQGSDKMDVKLGGNLGVASDGAVHIKAAMAMVIEAGSQLTLKVGGSSVVLGPAGVTIDGPLVKINCGGSGGSGGGASPKAVVAYAAPEEKKDPLG